MIYASAWKLTYIPYILRLAVSALLYHRCRYLRGGLPLNLYFRLARLGRGLAALPRLFKHVSYHTITWTSNMPEHLHPAACYSSHSSNHPGSRYAASCIHSYLACVLSHLDYVHVIGSMFFSLESYSWRRFRKSTLGSSSLTLDLAWL